MYRSGSRIYTAIALAIMLGVLALAAATLVDASRNEAAAAPQTTLSARSAAAGPAVASPRITMQIDGVDGESSLPGFEGWVDLTAIEWGGERVGGTGRARVIEVDEFAVALKYEKAAVKLTEAMLEGKLFPEINVELTKTINGQRLTYLRYELESVVVESFETRAARRPADSYRLAFTKLKAIYTEYDAAGRPLGTVEYEYSNRS